MNPRPHPGRRIGRRTAAANPRRVRRIHAVSVMFVDVTDSVFHGASLPRARLTTNETWRPTS